MIFLTGCISDFSPHFSPNFLKRQAHDVGAGVGLGHVPDTSFICLRAMRQINPGDFLTQRDWPKGLVTTDKMGPVYEGMRLNDYEP